MLPLSVKMDVDMRHDRIKLCLSALVKVVMGVALVGALLFLPAGTLAYDGAWRLCVVLFVPMLVMGVVMFVLSPELLRRRLASREERATQRGVVRYAGLLFVVSFVVAGLDFRYGWSAMPLWSFEKSHGIDYNIIKIHCIGTMKILLIKLIQRRNLLKSEITACILLELFRAYKAVLSFADFCKRRLVTYYTLFDIECTLTFFHRSA